MDEPRKRFRFGFRLLLLVVALLAALLAWRHAVSDRLAVERGLQRSNLEIELRRLEHSRILMQRDLQASSSVALRRSRLARILASMDADIAAMKLKLNDLGH